jgi:hypothetical protein
MRQSVSEEIDAAEVEAICNVLKAALPELVAIAFRAFKADEFAVRTIAAGLSDTEWKRVKRDENRRRTCKRQRKTTNEITGGNIGSLKSAGTGKP